MKNFQTVGNRPSVGGMLLQHVIVFQICVVFPGLVTLMAPATWLTFERSGDAVSCTTRSCVFFIVPFKTRHVDTVTGISHRARSGGTRKETKFGRTTGNTIHVDGEGFLQIHGADDQLVEISVSPVSLESVASRSNAFLNSIEEGSTTIFAIANWKFGGLMGGVLTSFTGLYVVGYTLGCVKWLFAGMRRTFASRDHS